MNIVIEHEKQPTFCKMGKASVNSEAHEGGSQVGFLVNLEETEFGCLFLSENTLVTKMAQETVTQLSSLLHEKLALDTDDVTYIRNFLLCTFVVHEIIWILFTTPNLLMVLFPNPLWDKYKIQVIRQVIHRSHCYRKIRRLALQKSLIVLRSFCSINFVWRCRLEHSHALSI